MSRVVGALIGIAIYGYFASCDSTETTKARNESYRQIQVGDAWERVRLGVYVNDERTGLCFLVTQPSHFGATMATVPCSPEVLALVGK